MNTVLLDDDEQGAVSLAPFTDPICPHCGQAFERRQKNQKYCNPSCQKKASRNASRGSTSADHNADRRDAKRRQRATLAWLNETYYGTPPGQRLGLLKDWLDKARNGDTLLQATRQAGWLNLTRAPHRPTESRLEDLAGIRCPVP